MIRDVVSVLNLSVLRRFLERLDLVLVLKVERLGLEGSASRSRLSLEGPTSRSRLGVEGITSRSRVSGFVTSGLVNIGTMHQAFGYIRKKIMDLKTNYATRKKQVVK